jgi:hypothetical protein
VRRRRRRFGVRHRIRRDRDERRCRGRRDRLHSRGLFRRRGRPSDRLRDADDAVGDELQDRLPESRCGQRVPRFRSESRHRRGQGPRLHRDRSRRCAQSGQAGVQHAAAARPKRQRDHLLSTRSKGDHSGSAAGEETERSRDRDRRELRQHGPGAADRDPGVAGSRHPGVPPGERPVRGEARRQRRPDRHRHPGPRDQVPHRPPAVLRGGGRPDGGGHAGQPVRRRHRRREGGECAAPAQPGGRLRDRLQRSLGARRRDRGPGDGQGHHRRRPERLERRYRGREERQAAGDRAGRPDRHRQPDGRRGLQPDHGAEPSSAPDRHPSGCARESGQRQRDPELAGSAGRDRIDRQERWGGRGRPTVPSP